MNRALGSIEVGGWSPAMVALDAMLKASGSELVQAELNDGPGVCLKIAGPLADVKAAVEAAEAIVAGMQVPFVAGIIPAPDPGSSAAIVAGAEVSPLIEQSVVHIPKENSSVSEQANYAVGMIETQGFTAVFDAIDTALKAADVEVVAREKLGGGYITVVIKGDVAAVTAAIEAGKARVNGLGRLIAAHVIASPSEGVLSLLPQR